MAAKKSNTFLALLFLCSLIYKIKSKVLFYKYICFIFVFIKQILMSAPIHIRTHKVGLKVPKYVLMVLKKEEHFDEEGYLVLTGNALVGKAFIANALEIPFEFPERPYSSNILNIRLTDRLWVFYQVHRGHVEGFYEKMALRMIMCRIDTLHKITGLSIKDSIDRVYDYYGLSIMEYDQATAEQNYKIYRGVIRKKNNTT